MLIANETEDYGSDPLDEQVEQQTCTCHESIRNSEHHLCKTAKQPNKQPTKSSNHQGGGAILNYGRNLLRYTLISKKGTIVATAEAHLYLWRSSDSIVVSDVDGTVTKSDVRGVINTVIQDKFEYCHAGICKFYHEILDAGLNFGGDNDGDDCREEDGDEFFAHVTSSSKSQRKREEEGEIRFLYLSSRPIMLVGQTRKLLVSLSQTCPSKNMYGLPPGPIMCHTGPLSSVLYSELISKNIYEFKADVLSRQVVLPFVAARGEDWNNASSSSHGGNDIDESPRRSSFSERSETSSSFWDDRLFLAGFGNKLTDAKAYEMAGIDRHDIYIIDKESHILCMGGGDSVEEGNNERRCSVDRSSMTSSTSEHANLSITKGSNGVLCDQQSDWSLAEACGTGVSELSIPLHADNASSSNTNRVASSIHSIELSLSDEGESDDAQGGSLAISTRTAVNIYVTNEQQRNNGNTISASGIKRAKIKQSIRAFSSKKTFSMFPSFGSVNSKVRKSSSPKKLYQGYDDPLLLARVRERMIGWA